MKVAVFSNARCTVGACSPTVGWTHSFNTAFRAGGVMGFSLTGVALLSLYALLVVLKPFFGSSKEGTVELMECVAGFGLGGSRSDGCLRRLSPPTDALPAATALGLGPGGLRGGESSRRSLFSVLARRLWLRYLLLPPSAPASAACEAIGGLRRPLSPPLLTRGPWPRRLAVSPPSASRPTAAALRAPGPWRLASDWALTALPLGSRALSAQATAMGSSGSLGGSSAAVGGTRAAAAHARRSVAHAR